MIDNSFREWLEPKTDFIVLCYTKMGISPNGLTLIGLIISILSAISCYHEYNYTAILLWWISRFFDGTDGILARRTQKTSPFGAYIDILSDMASYSFMIIAMALRFPEMILLWLTTIFLYILCITSALSLGQLLKESNIQIKNNRGLNLGAGLIEGGETGMAYTIFLLASDHIKVLLVIWVILLTITVILRTFLAFKMLKGAKQ